MCPYIRSYIVKPDSVNMYIYTHIYTYNPYVSLYLMYTCQIYIYIYLSLSHINRPLHVLISVRMCPYICPHVSLYLMYTCQIYIYIYIYIYISHINRSLHVLISPYMSLYLSACVLISVLIYTYQTLADTFGLLIMSTVREHIL